MERGPGAVDLRGAGSALLFDLGGGWQVCACSLQDGSQGSVLIIYVLFLTFVMLQYNEKFKKVIVEGALQRKDRSNRSLLH